MRGSNSGGTEEGAVVELVNIEVAELEPGVTLACENEQEASEGNPAEHASDTEPVKPTLPCGAMVTV